MAETVEQQMKDSDTIWRKIMVDGGFKPSGYKKAENLIVALFVPDMSYSRSGISHVLGRLKRHFKELEANGGC